MSRRRRGESAPPPPPSVAGFLCGPRVGHGGSAEIYRARDPQTDLVAALKIANRRFKTPRFEREYQLLNAFHHPNLPRVYRLGTLPSDGRPYLLMQLLEGRSARAYVRLLGAPGAPSRVLGALRVVYQSARVLQALHAVGILHGDLKPSNIHVHRGHAWLLDLGGARDLRADVPWMKSGRFFGTYGYSPLEQLEGRAVDLRADLFSLGVTARVLLTGEQPAKETRRDREAAIHLLREAGPSRLPSDVAPGDVADLIVRLTARAPEERPDSIEAVLAVLEPHLGSGGVSPPPPTTRSSCSPSRSRLLQT